MTGTTHEDIIKNQIYLAKLWLDVCEEQEKNDFNWEETKKKLLSDWNDQGGMTVDFWSEYMRALFVENAINHYLVDRNNKKNKE